MDTSSYALGLGAFSFLAVRDGGMNYPLDTMVANVGGDGVAEVLRERGLSDDRIYTPYTCLFVDTGDHRVMIDTGAGNLGALAAHIFPGIDHTTSGTGHVIGNLRAAGIEPSTVDTVIITHAHPDHIGGTLNDDGSLVFGNASYVISEDEWAFWFSEHAERKTPPSFVALARGALSPLEDRMAFVRDGDEIVPGIRAMATPGHTPGHIALMINPGNETLLHISDVVLYPLLMEYPEWVPVFDIDPVEAAASKQRTLDMAADQGTLVFAHHFPPFPNLGHVRKRARGWEWVPIAMEDA
jgi:glyoxylase-like metal-dependent hydrolase (beta-lactamase superfamily II)